MPGRQPDRHINHPVNYRTGETLLDILDTILDKGLVIDIFVSVSLVGIELLKIEARIIVSSVDTYLRLAEAAARLADEYDRDIIGPLAGAKRDPGLTQTMGNLAGEIGGAKGRAKSQGVVEGVKEAVRGNK